MFPNTCRLLVPRIVASSRSPNLNTSLGSRFYSIMSPDPGYNNKTVGPFPKTKEERELAAKKYNLIPEDYETYEEGDALGDYPKLPEIGQFNRDPYEDYDSPEDRRHYAEPYHLHHDLYQWERVDPLKHKKPDVKLWLKCVILFGSFGSLTFILWAAPKYDININHNHKQRAMFPDQVHYEFPPSKNDHVHHLKLY